MGQAAVDLPDPLEQPSSAGAVNNADDLLAQLAGDEIDRLLAEAEVEQESAAPVEDPTATDESAVDEAPVAPTPSPAPAAPIASAPAPAMPVAPGPEPDADEILQDVLKSADATVQQGLRAAAPNVESVEPPKAPIVDKATAKAAAFQEQLQGQLDDLFTELTKEPAASSSPATAQPAAPTAPVVPAEAAPIPPAASSAPVRSESASELDQSLSAAAPGVLPKVDDVDASARVAVNEKKVASSDDETSAAERSALEEASATSIDAITQQLDALDADGASAGDASLPIYLRPLEWLNAPFESISQPVREALGKVALITLINAIAVLLYVVIFR